MRHKINIKNRKYNSGAEASYNAMVNRYKQKAKIRKLAWNISKPKAKDLLKQNCHYCGSKPSNEYNVYVTKSRKYKVNSLEWQKTAWIKYNGIDRLNNKFGYSNHNCVSCCKTCNFAKHTQTLKEFENWITNLVKYRIKYDKNITR